LERKKGGRPENVFWMCAGKGERWIRSELEVEKDDLTIISVHGEQGGKNLIEGLDTCVEVKNMENVIIGGILI